MYTCIFIRDTSKCVFFKFIHFQVFPTAHLGLKLTNPRSRIARAFDRSNKASHGLHQNVKVFVYSQDAFILKTEIIYKAISILKKNNVRNFF